MAGYKFWQRRESINMKVAKNHKSSCILEAISGRDAAEGPKQMKIVVKKEEMKQLLEAIRDRRGPPLDHRLNLLRRRQILRAAAGQAKARSRSGSWRPVLHSIPEEL